METYDMSFASETEVDLDPGDVILQRSYTRRLQSAATYLHSIDELLATFDACPQVASDRLNARLVCLIYREPQMPETLVISDSYMSYRGRVCRVDTLLVRRIVDSLSDKSRKAYDWWLRTFVPYRNRR